MLLIEQSTDVVFGMPKPEKSFYIKNAESLDRAIKAISKIQPSKEKCYRD